ncbi:MAG TPA: aspartate dehydrogenase [Sphingomonas sp.]
MTRNLKVGIIGLGVIGGAVLRAIAEDPSGLILTAVCVRDAAAGRAKLAALGVRAQLRSLGELVEACDVVFDGAVAASLPEIGHAALSAGRTLVTMNSGALLDAPDLFDLAAARGGRIVVPSGGVAGFDGIRAACLSDVQTLTLVSRKPPESLRDAPHVVQRGYDLEGLSEPLCVFAGNAREAARAFPANANVAATLSLAGPGPERTRVEMWADPTVTRITQQIHLVSAAAELRLEIQSNAMPENPKTGSLTPLSAIAALRSLVATVRIGS